MQEPAALNPLQISEETDHPNCKVPSDPRLSFESNEIAKMESKISTVRRKTMSGTQEKEVGQDSMRHHNRPDSIEINESDSQSEKQEELRISIVRGIQEMPLRPIY
jgi:hypothetical protein